MEGANSQLRVKHAMVGAIPAMILLVLLTRPLMSSPTPPTSSTNVSSIASGPYIESSPLSSCADAAQQGGLRNCVNVVATDNQTLDLQICSSSTLELQVSDVGETSPFSSVSLSFDNPVWQTGIILPGGNHTVGSQTLPGTYINLNLYASYSPSVFSLSKGATMTVTLTMAIPCDLSQAVIGQTAYLEISPTVVGPSTSGPSIFVSGISVPVVFQ